MDFLPRVVFLFLAVLSSGLALATDDGWEVLFDGTSLEGWKANESAETWKVEDGVLRAEGPMSHLFYVGPDGATQFGDFELKVEARTAPRTNSGVFFRQPWQDKGWLQKGVEAQLQNSGPNTCYTGGLWIHADFAGPSPVKDGEWFELFVRAEGGRITVQVNGQTVTEYDEATDSRKNLTGRRLGFLALQGHGPTHRPEFRRICIRRLDAQPEAARQETQPPPKTNL